MGTGKVLLIGSLGVAILYGGAYLYRQTSLLKDTDFKLKSLKRISQTKDSITIEMISTVTNKSNIDFDVYGQSYDLYLSNKFVGKATSSDVITIPKKGVAEIKILITIDYQKALEASISALTESLSKATLNIKGTVNTKTIGLILNGIPVNVDISLADILK